MYEETDASGNKSRRTSRREREMFTRQTEERHRETSCHIVKKDDDERDRSE